MYRFLACFVAVVGLFVVGCGSSAKNLQVETSNIRAVSIVLGKYRSQNKGQSPPNEEALKSFAATLKPEELKSFGASSAEDIFISSRDKQPYKFNFGDSSSPTTIVVYEQQGSGGKRFVVNAVGKAEELDEAEFKKLFPDS